MRLAPSSVLAQALLPGTQVSPPESDVAADAVAGRTLAALAQSVELVKREPEEPGSLAGGHEAEPVVARRQVLAHGLPQIDANFGPCPRRRELSSDLLFALWKTSNGVARTD